MIPLSDGSCLVRIPSHVARKMMNRPSSQNAASSTHFGVVQRIAHCVSFIFNFCFSALFHCVRAWMSPKRGEVVPQHSEVSQLSASSSPQTQADPVLSLEANSSPSVDPQPNEISNLSVTLPSPPGPSLVDHAALVQEPSPVLSLEANSSPLVDPQSNEISNLSVTLLPPPEPSPGDHTQETDLVSSNSGFSNGGEQELSPQRPHRPIVESSQEGRAPRPRIPPTPPTTSNGDEQGLSMTSHQPLAGIPQEGRAPRPRILPTPHIMTPSISESVVQTSLEEVSLDQTPIAEVITQLDQDDPLNDQKKRILEFFSGLLEPYVANAIARAFPQDSRYTRDAQEDKFFITQNGCNITQNGRNITQNGHSRALNGFESITFSIDSRFIISTTERKLIFSPPISFIMLEADSVLLLSFLSSLDQHEAQKLKLSTVETKGYCNLQLLSIKKDQNTSKYEVCFRLKGRFFSERSFSFTLSSDSLSRMFLRCSSYIDLR